MLVILPVGQVFLEVLGWVHGLYRHELPCPAHGAAGVAAAWQADDRTDRGRSRQHDHRQALREAFQHRSYVLLVFGFFVCGFHVSFIGTHLPAYVTDIGLPPETGAAALVTIGVVNIISAYTTGVLGGAIQQGQNAVGDVSEPCRFYQRHAISAADRADHLHVRRRMGLSWLSTVH